MPATARPVTPVPHSAEDEAVAWFVRLQDEEATAADRESFAAWLARDPAHRAAWNEIDRIWRGLGDIPIGEPAREGAAAIAPAPPPARRARRLWRPLAAAAMILLAVTLARQLLPTGLFADHRTALAERRTIPLPDGSVVELAPLSALDVDVRGERRHVRLLAGEAFFTVARDPARRFVVEAGDGRVEVLGTAFDMRIDGGSVAVAVAHNAVAVSAGRGAAVQLERGQAARYDEAGISPVSEIDPEAVAPWRHDQLVFHDTPLSQVLAELGRYRRGHVQLIGRDLGARRITAVFDARQPDAAIATIARSLNLRELRATSLFVALADW
jgi:transmembrane sensor